MQLTREEPLIEIGGARSEATAAWRLVVVEVAVKMIRQLWTRS
jgi:hypothetical protein